MKKSFIVLFIIFIGFNLHAADWNITGAGARATGMGGAFIGVADDATAISWNPAGLTQLYRPEVSLVARYIAENYKYESTFFSNSVDNQGHFIVNFASAAFPLMNGKLVAAIAYQKQLDWYSGWQDEDEKSTGGANTLIPGMAYRVFPVLSLGFSTNIWMGNSEEEGVYGYHPYEYEYDFIDRTVAFSGLNFVFGIMADFNNLQKPFPLKLGVTMRTPFDLEVEVEADYYYYYDLDYTNTVDMPMMLGFGTSYKFGENLTLSADYEIRAFGDSKINYGLGGDPSNLSASEENLNQIRVGAEYLVVTDFAVIPFRAGFKTIPTLLSNGEDSEYTDQTKGTGFSLGTGLIFERVAIDATFDLSSYKQEWDNWPDYGESESGTYKKYNSTISCIFYF
ncbi:MAG: outer membrane protein transport protein [Candidatus Cloacimonetes bacterium]|nr:outer membrane protein transport protein [Candidatus Cloacimonadota bacterium]